MKKILFTTLPLLLILGCGDATTPTQNNIQIQQENTKKIRALGVDFEWQSDIDTKKNWKDALDFCAQKQMRLPSPSEFYALLETNQSIDTLFPSDIKEFWTNAAFSDNKAWKITTWSSSQSYHDKQALLGVRCLKGATLPTHFYTKSTDSFIDKNGQTNETKLWQDENDNSINRLTFVQATSYCNAKNMRLPTLFELQQLTDAKPTFVKKDDFLSYWTSTPLPTDNDSILTVNFTTNGVLFSDKTQNNHLRCIKTIDTTPPVITLNGTSSITLNQHETYSELGASAYDAIDGDVPVTITGSVDIHTAGFYTITYSAKDKANNQTTDITRTITIKDTTKPTITLNGSNPQTILVGHTYTELGATATDNVGVVGAIRIDTTTVNTQILGNYTVSYTILDIQGNTQTITRTISIIDTTAPIITLKGANPQTIEVKSSYSELGATALDNMDTNLTNSIIIDTSNLNTNTIGTYTVTYNATDSSANSATEVSRTIRIIDSQKPTITVSGINPIHVEVGTNYIDAGATATDNYDTNLAVTTTGTVDNNTLGTYTLYFNVTDSSTNYAIQKTRTVIVEDTTAPTITLIGNKTISISLGTNYIDAGATATDNYDGDITSHISILNPVDFNAPNTYIVKYNVSDTNGNTATELRRTVIVESSSAPISSFTPHTVTNNAKNSEWLEMVDLDKDGDLDILSASTGAGGKVAWHENRGNLTFTTHTIAPAANKPESVKAADINGDGHLDILYTTYETGASLMLCLNDKSNNFPICSKVSNATDGLSFIKIVSLDTTNDNLPDIITASWGNDKIEWLKNVGDGTFTGAHMIDDQNTNKVISIDTADFNKDGKVDIIAAHNGSNRIDWYAYNVQNSGNFEHHFVADINAVYSVDVTDVNHDGYDDIIATSNGDNKVYWYKSTQASSPTFSTALEIANLTNVYYASGVDMDNDGDIDILSASSKSSGKIAWYENIGSDTNFPEHIITSNVDDVIRVFPADIDNDGDMDVIAGDKLGNVIVYENTKSLTTIQLPKTGDSNDGAQSSFTRDDINEIVSDTLTGLTWQDNSAVKSGAKNWNDLDLENDCKLTIGGHTDWRFPNKYELYYLAQKGNIILDNIFQNSSILLKDYWTSSPNKVYVSFSRATSHVAQSLNYIRCVRGKPITIDLIRDDTKQVVLDKKHKLMWEDGINSANKTASLGQADAQVSCTTLDYLGFNDWRLPNIHELYAIFDDEGLNNAFKNKNDAGSTLISTTTYNKENYKAYGMNVNTRLDIQLPKTDPVKFRCLRDIP